MDSRYTQIKQLPLFQGVSQDKILALIEKLPFHFLKFRSGERIVDLQDACTHIQFVVSGKVRLVTPWQNLRVTLEQILNAPNMLAPDFLFGREIHYPFIAYAEGTCGIVQLRKSDYIQVINSDKIFLFNILNHLSMNSQRATTSILSITRGTIAERLAMCVQALTSSTSQEIKLKFKQRDLCALLGVTRSTLIRTLDKLSAQGILTYSANEINILDSRSLKSIIHA